MSARIARFAGAANWDLEQSYENQPRKLKRKKVQEHTRLPIKTAAGIVHTTEAPPSPAASDSSGESETEADGVPEKGKGDGAWAGIEEEALRPEEPKKPERQRILEAKEELARIAALVNEDPEENVGAFKHLRAMACDSSPTIVKLALATQLAVYKDVIPGYRIRPLTPAEEKEKASKEVKKLRAFEQGLLANYQQYVAKLAELSRMGRGADAAPVAVSIGKIAVNCACGLLAHVPHFNFRVELLKIVVERVSVRTVDEVYEKCAAALERLFREDEDGHASLDAIQLVTKMLKSRKYNVNERVLNTFLHLRLLTELDAAGSHEGVETEGRKRKRKEREFRTKKERKTAKEVKKVEKEMKEADATVSHEEREKCQAESLKAVFVVYFQILKERNMALMGAVLEGLAKYARLINLDFFGDILVALREMITTLATSDEDTGDRNTTREALLCIITAFALQSSQSTEKALTLDLAFFTQHLYATLLPASLSASLEDSTRSLRLPDPSSASPPAAAASRVNVSTEIELLLRGLELLLFRPDAHTRPEQLAAFTKRLLSATLHMPEKSAAAVAGVLARLARKHHRRLQPLWNDEDAVGDGEWRGDVDDPARANPGAATAWEVCLLQTHYSPRVRAAVDGLEQVFREKEGVVDRRRRP